MVAGMKNGEMRRGPVFEQRLVLALDHFESADAAADVDADALGVFGVHLQARTAPARIRRRDGELDEAAHLLDFFFFDVAGWIEALTSPAMRQEKSRGVELP